MFSRGPLGRVAPVLDGGVLGRQAEGVEADGVEHVVAPHAQVAGQRVTDGVDAGVAHVHGAGGVREHLQHVARLGVRPAPGPEDAGLVPALLPARLDRLRLVAFVHRHGWAILADAPPVVCSGARHAPSPVPGPRTARASGHGPPPSARAILSPSRPAPEPPHVPARLRRRHRPARGPGGHPPRLALQPRAPPGSSTSSRSGTAPGSSSAWSSRGTSRPRSSRRPTTCPRRPAWPSPAWSRRTSARPSATSSTSADLTGGGAGRRPSSPSATRSTASPSSWSSATSGSAPSGSTVILRVRAQRGEGHPRLLRRPRLHPGRRAHLHPRRLRGDHHALRGPLLRPRQGLPDPVRPALHGGGRHGARQGLLLRPDLPRREVQDPPPPDRVLDGGAGGGLHGPGRRHGADGAVRLLRRPDRPGQAREGAQDGAGAGRGEAART